MFSLWKFINKLKNAFNKIPSPKCRKRHFSNGFSIEGASLPASMTVEACIIIPLFLFFFINLGSVMEMIRLHGNLQLAMWNVGNQMCVYGYVASENQNMQESHIKDIALTYTYVKGQVVEYAGENYLEEAPLSDGTGGLQFWESNLLRKDAAAGGEVIDVLMTYQVSPWLEIPFVKPFRMSNRYYGRVWTGYDLGGGMLEPEPDKDLVYITENRSVYHETISCTHLKLSIHEITLKDLVTARNDEGRKYSQCSKCGHQPYTGTLYICDDGDYFHYNRDCSGLKRTISSITRQKAISEGLRPCSRCRKVK